jgi:hypothetical protein
MISQADLFDKATSYEVWREQKVTKPERRFGCFYAICGSRWQTKAPRSAKKSWQWKSRRPSNKSTRHSSERMPVQNEPGELGQALIRIWPSRREPRWVLGRSMRWPIVATMKAMRSRPARSPASP